MDEDRPLSGLTVAAFESRMAPEMARLITRYGGRPLVAPSMREIPLQDHGDVLAFGTRLLAGECDMLILLTGVGTRTMIEALQTRHSRESLRAALARTTLVARGPKSLAALKELGLTAAIAVPEPNTWHDILNALDTASRLGKITPLDGRRIAVQEYGVSNDEFLRALTERGARVTRISVYRWALPDDVAPLTDAIAAILRDAADIMLITNAVQIDHVMQLVTKNHGPKGVDQFHRASTRMIVASIGPTASERLRTHGLTVDFEPSHPKMGLLVKEVSERARSLLAVKRPVS